MPKSGPKRAELLFLGSELLGPKIGLKTAEIADIGPQIVDICWAFKFDDLRRSELKISPY